MAKYLFIANYNAEGLKGVLDKGGTARAQAVDKACRALGGKLEYFYFAFGHDDVYAVVEIPDNVNAAAVAMTVGASGVAQVRTVPLLTTEEVDQAAKVKVSYLPPGR